MTTTVTEDVAELQRQLENVRAILQGCSFDLQLARQQRDEAYKEVKALRAEMKAHGITPEGDDDVDGW